MRWLGGRQSKNVEDFTNVTEINVNWSHIDEALTLENNDEEANYKIYPDGTTIAGGSIGSIARIALYYTEDLYASGDYLSPTVTPSQKLSLIQALTTIMDAMGNVTVRSESATLFEMVLTLYKNIRG